MHSPPGSHGQKADLAMSDKSPKSVQKKSAQKQTKADQARKAKEAIEAAKRVDHPKK